MPVLGAHRSAPDNLRDGRGGTPPTATWLMLRGCDIGSAAGYFGISPEVLTRVDGHHHPEQDPREASHRTEAGRQNNAIWGQGDDRVRSEHTGITETSPHQTLPAAAGFCRVLDAVNRQGLFRMGRFQACPPIFRKSRYAALSPACAVANGTRIRHAFSLVCAHLSARPIALGPV